jgi:hypothetical protein
LRRFFLKTRNFGPRDSPSTTPITFALAQMAHRDDVSAISLDKQHLLKGELSALLAQCAVHFDDGPGRNLQLRPRDWMIAYT